MNLLQSVHQKTVMTRRVRTLAKHIVRLLPLADREETDRNVPLTGLDVGCGSGEIAAAVQQLQPNLDLQGVDVLVRGVTHIPITEFDGHTLPFADNSFDFVLLIDVLHHTDRPDRILAECIRVARRAVIIKDHYCNNWFDNLRLRFMDWVGNRGHGVRLPYNYLSTRGWYGMFGQLRLFPEVTLYELRLYPLPFRWVFDGQLHFMTRLRCLNDLRTTIETLEASQNSAHHVSHDGSHKTSQSASQSASPNRFYDVLHDAPRNHALRHTSHNASRA